MVQDKQIRMAFMLEGHGRTAYDWMHPDAVRNAGSDFEFNKQQTLLAEKGKFDFVFVADTLYCNALSDPHRLNRLEPLALLCGLAAVTTHIGLAGTFSTTFSEPFTIARQLASLDHMSNGRAGWNLVTSDPQGAGENYGGLVSVAHGDRFRRAREYLDVVQGLWDSWDDDAFPQDKGRGVFMDPERMHVLDHKGEFFQVMGPLNICRSPQGHPLLVTPTFSDDGTAFAGERCDAVFGDPETLEQAQAWYRKIKDAARNVGRDPDHVHVMPNAKPIVGSTEAEVQRLREERFANSSFAMKLRFLSKNFKDHDLSVYDPDEPFPEDVLKSGLVGFEGTVKRIEQAARSEKLTLRQVAQRFGHPADRFWGTPERVADEMQAWVNAGGGDGFIMGEPLPGQLARFVNEVVPILQRRGVFKSDYEHATLREDVGLPRVANRLTKARTIEAAAT